MAVKMGRDGMVKIGGDVVAYIDNWSMDANIDALEVTAFGNKNRAYAYGLKNVTAQMSGAFDATDTAQLAIRDTFMSTSTAAKTTAILIWNSSATTGAIKGYSGTALLTNISIGSAVGDKITFSASLQFDGGVSAYTTT